MNILFRVEANATIGLGHLMRCLALSQALKIHGVGSLFALNPEAKILAMGRNDWVGDLHTLPIFNSVQEEILYLADLAAHHNCFGLVLDGYQFDQRYRQALYDIPVKHICFDDSNTMQHLFTDLVINGAQQADQLNYSATASNAILCLGKEYRILRQEFYHQAQSGLHPRDSLTIVMGGSDPSNLTLPLVRAFIQQRFSGRLQVLTGSAYKHSSALSELVDSSKLNIDYQHDCQNIAQQFWRSKLVVSAAGGSQFELQACGCAAVLLVVADNQLLATQYAYDQGGCDMLDIRHGFDSAQLAQLTIELWSDQERLTNMSKKAASLFDHNGCNRLVAQIKHLVM